MLALTGLGVLLVLLLEQPQSRIVAAVLFGLLLFVVLTALRDWHKSPTGTLQWDGAHWHWRGHADQAPCLLTLHMDWQTVVLVSLRSEDTSTVWLWLESADDALRWKALRRAIVSSRRLDNVEHDTARCADNPGAAA
jgi:hypothetical protein